MNDNKNKSFLDPNTLIAIVITFALFFGWQQYLKVKYPDSYKANLKNKKELIKNDNVTNTSVNGEPVNAVLDKKENTTDSLNAAIEPASEPTLTTFEDKYWYLDFNSRGLSVEGIKIKDINRVKNKAYVFKYPKLVFPTYYNNRVVNFKVSQINNNKLEGLANLPGGGTLKKTILINSESFTLDVTIELLGVPKNNAFTIDHPIQANITDPKKVIFFLPAFDRNEFYIDYADSDERRILSTDKQTEKENFSNVKLYSLSDHYFSIAFLNEGKLSPNSSFEQNNSKISSLLSYNFTNEVNVDKISYSLFIGPKRLDLLEKKGPPLLDLIDFNILGFVARPIVKVLNSIFALVGNYGLAVIILTFLIRLLIMPLAVSSFKSMKKMQKIQPKLKEIKEKHKNDKQKVQLLTMQIMKENKVNPLGGCLPMVLQLPVFFAFYRGLSESVDLYQAPFFLWITDLTKVDPYFILPLISIVGMVVHQLITPNTMEKSQKRLMLIMPLVFGLFIFTLPSALTLYMVVTTWFGIAQHAIFLRDKPTKIS